MAFAPPGAAAKLGPFMENCLPGAHAPWRVQTRPPRVDRFFFTID